MASTAAAPIRGCQVGERGARIRRQIALMHASSVPRPRWHALCSAPVRHAATPAPRRLQVSPSARDGGAHGARGASDRARADGAERPRHHRECRLAWADRRERSERHEAPAAQPRGDQPSGLPRQPEHPVPGHGDGLRDLRHVRDLGLGSVRCRLHRREGAHCRRFDHLLQGRGDLLARARADDQPAREAVHQGPHRNRRLSGVSPRQRVHDHRLLPGAPRHRRRGLAEEGPPRRHRGANRALQRARPPR